MDIQKPITYDAQESITYDARESIYEVPMLAEVGNFNDLTRGLPAGVKQDDAFQYQ